MTPTKTSPDVAAVVEQTVGMARSLLCDEVINNTFGLMNRLGANLSFLATVAASLSHEQKQALGAWLLQMSSESIREALHKGELPITNSVIKAKNSILTALGVTIPETHREINPADYPMYNW